MATDAGRIGATAEAAFFDLDKTVIAKASMMAFGSSFYREGLINRRSLLRGVWTQLCYVHLGADANRLAKIRSSVLALTAGWQQDRVRRVVTAALARVIDPITYAEALDLIAEHRRAGRFIYIVSAAPAEIVGPLADHLGVTDVIASQAEVDLDGCYTGRMERYTYGPAKADLIREIAARRGIDLSRSWAYSDSATDLPMLEAVGHPVALNPPRPLRHVAAERGWQILHFDRIIEPVPKPHPSSHHHVPIVATVAAAVVATTSAGATVRWWWRRGPSQAERIFLAAKNDRPSNAAIRTIFFMGSR